MLVVLVRASLCSVTAAPTPNTTATTCATTNAFDSRQYPRHSLHEGLQLFEEVVQNPIFQDTPMFVFLNKKDLFEQMMREDGVPLTRCFPDYRVSFVRTSWIIECRQSPRRRFTKYAEGVQ